jgi:ketosteroid isomerase-like protein
VDTRTVVQGHLDALLAADVERTLADYTDESVMIASGSVLKGLDALRPVFAMACEMFAPESSEFTLDSFDVDGEYGLITWRLRFDGGEITFGTDTFHVRDGKIALQAAAFQMA